MKKTSNQSSKRHPLFPALNLSINWYNQDEINELILFDDYFYADEEKFNILLRNHRIIDCNGMIFTATNLRINSKWWRGLPFLQKSKVLYRDELISMELDELKSFILERINGLPRRAVIDEWTKRIVEAKEFKDLFVW